METKNFSNIVIKQLEEKMKNIENNSDLIEDSLFEKICSRISEFIGMPLSDAIEEATLREIPIMYSDIYKEAQYYQEEIMEIIRNETIPQKVTLTEILQKGIEIGYEKGIEENIDNVGLYVSYSNVIEYIKNNREEFDKICSHLNSIDKDFDIEQIVEKLNEIAVENGNLYVEEKLNVDENPEKLTEYFEDLKKSLDKEQEKTSTKKWNIKKGKDLER